MRRVPFVLCVRTHTDVKKIFNLNYEEPPVVCVPTRNISKKLYENMILCYCYY